MSKLILASNLPRAERPMQVVGAHMQKFCNCGGELVTAHVDGKAEAKSAAA